MAFSSFTQSFRTSETDEKNHSSMAQFIPLAYKFGRNRSDASKSSMTVSTSCSASECSQSDHEFSSTDAGDDICTTYVDFDDFASTSSDEEVSTPSPRRQETASACVYSVMMLLHLRAAVCDEESDTTVRYGTQCRSELADSKAKSPKARVSTGDSWRASTANAGDSWRSAATPADTWRQTLPESTADSWVAQQRKQAASEERESDKNVTRALRSLLNKLTMEKFDSLFEQLVTCGITCSNHISILMREVFEKATIQHHFIPMYAELCVKLEKDARIADVVEEADLPNNFRRLLLNECQNVFEQLLELRSIDDTEDEETIFRRKQRALGNMKLIGQLLVHGMLSSDLFTGCCEELLRKRTLCPEALESLVALVMVAGPKFDYRAWQCYQRLEKIFAEMQALTKDKSVLPRLRFLIRDVLDAREAGWPSSLGGGKTPTTLEEVRNAVESPTQQKEDPSECCSSPKSPHDTRAASGNTGACAKAQVIGSDDTKKEGKVHPWSKKKAVQFSQEESPENPASSVPKSAAPPTEAFNVVTFRKALASIFSDLASEKNIPAAVQRVRLQQVPVDKQAEQFLDILTRIVEERRGAVRRCELAFLTGLAAAEDSAFDRKECLAGIGRFFNEVYADLCNEVHRLPAIMKSEFMPTVLNVFPAAELNKVVPPSMRK